MGKVLNKVVPKKVRSYFKKRISPFSRKYLSPVKKFCYYVFRWRVFWSLVIVFILGTVYYPPLGDMLINFMARQKPPFAKLPANAKWDPKTTIEYKEERMTVVRTSLKNVFLIIERDLGLKEEVASKKLVSVSTEMPVSQKIDNVAQLENDNSPVEGDLGIIRDNIVDAFKAYVDMLTVRVVSIDNRPVMIGDNGEIVPYDKTDKILQWAKYIEATSKKYDVDPAIIAAIIEQESGGNATVQSHAGAIGLMQLMPSTARGLGVNPYDPAQNIDGGTRYFMIQYRQFGSVVQALAAYNAGPNNVRNGNYLYFPETQGYITKVPRLIEKYQRIFAKVRSK